MSIVLFPITRVWLCDYSLGEAIILETTLLSLKRPSPRTLEAYRHVFNNVSAGKSSFPTLGGSSCGILDDRNDLMALRMPQEDDRLTRLLRHYCPVFFTVRPPLPPEPKTPMAFFDYHGNPEVDYATEAQAYEPVDTQSQY